MSEWLQENEVLLTVIVLAVSVGGLLFVPWLVARIPADYFATLEPPPGPWSRAHPVLRVVLVVAKNLLGAVLLVAGILMLFLPGQGILTMLVAVMLLDFPGKRRLELWLVRRRGLVRGIDWIRERGGRDALRLPPLD